VLVDKLDHHERWTERRHAVAARYDAALRDGDHRSVGVAPGRSHAFHKYVIRGPRRDEVRAALGAAGVPTLVHYASPLTRQPLFAGRSRAMPCPRANAACGEVLSLPVHAYLTNAEVEHVCSALRTAARPAH